MPGKILFLNSDIYAQATGGTLLDREIRQTLLDAGWEVTIRIPLSIQYNKSGRLPLIAGLLGNLAEILRPLPPRHILLINHGVYRDIFLALWLWRWLHHIRPIYLIYHYDYNLRPPGWSRRLRRLVESLAVLPSAALFTISSVCRQQTRELGVHPALIHDLPVSRRFHPLPAPPDPGPASGPPTLRLLYVGTLEPRKGALDAVRALALLPPGLSLELNIIGAHSPDSPYVQAILEESQKIPHIPVRLLGKAPDTELEAHLRASHIFLFPSHWEGYGIAIEEAMCFGLPVVAYAAGSIPELVTHGVEGWLAPVGDIPSLAQNLHACCADPAERHRRARAAWEKSRHLTATATPGQRILQFIKTFDPGPF